MTLRTKLAVAILLLGLTALIFGCFKYQSHGEVFRVGSFRATTTRERSIPALRVAGLGFMLVGGILLAIRSRPSEPR